MHILEPRLNRLITPLLFSFAGDGRRGTLLGTLDPDELFPTESVHARLGAAGFRTAVVLPAGIAAAAPNMVLLREGTDVVPFATPEMAFASAAEALRAPRGARPRLRRRGRLAHARRRA